jgi:hypothetical protein
MSNLSLTVPKGKELSIPDERAKQIAKAFIPLYEKYIELGPKYNSFIKTVDRENPTKEQVDLAKALLKKFVPIRTGIASVHKTEKESALNEGLFIDRFKNEHKASTGKVEGELKYIIEAEARKERQRLQQIHDSRVEILSPYTNAFPPGLAEMDEAIFEAVLAKAKVDYEEALKAEKEAKDKALKVDIYSARLSKGSAVRLDVSKLSIDTTALEWMQMYEDAKNEFAIAQQKEAEQAQKEKAIKDAELAEAQKQLALTKGSHLEKLIAFADQLDSLTVPELDGVPEFNKHVPDTIARITKYTKDLIVKFQ